MFSKSNAITCPLVKGECLEHKCAFWVQLMGKHPQTGADINMPDCAVRWLPLLLIENSKTGRETGAAVESFRNEMVKANQQTNSLLALSQQRMLRDAA